MKLFLFVIPISICQGFLPKPSLRTIIMNRGIYASLIEKISLELADDSTFSQLTQIGYTDYVHYANICISTCVIICLMNKPIDSKIETLQCYISSKKTTKYILLMIFIIFIKNIETAS